MSGAVIAYALIYPAISAWTGHPYPQSPTFGVTPCPVVLFTIGVLLLSEQRVPWFLAAIPLAWAVVGGSAAFLLGVPADFALPVAGVLLLILGRRSAH